MSRSPSLAHTHSCNRADANAGRAKPVATAIVPVMPFKVCIRRIDTGETIELAGFLRLTAHGAELPAEIGRMPAGSRVTWAGSTWEVQP